MRDVLGQINLIAIIDILLVTSLVYTAVVWLRRTKAQLVAIGILILGLLYVVARALNLQLTAWIFQGFFAVFLVIMVVIFQEELRQLFERLAVWGLRRRRLARLPVQLDPADILTRCAADFARDRIGALIVLPGEQPIQRHIQGGIELDGKLSLALLKSIFDPHSPGHDGAAIIEADRVARFAVHLPLSRDPVQLIGFGTRHAAALGLTELTDALCIVVSEERGRIAVARNGRLRGLQDAQELSGAIESLRAGERVRRPPLLALAQLRRNWIEKVASLVLVLGLWYAFVPGSRPALLGYRIPVKVVNLPPGLVVERAQPEEVRAVFSGPQRAFYLFDPEDLEVIIDGSGFEAGRRRVSISDRDLRHPDDIAVEEIEPSAVTIVVGRAPPPTAAPGRRGETTR